MTKSASNVAERTPVQRKGKATVVGAIGHAFAAVMIEAARSEGRAVLAKQKSMKDRLKELMAFPSNADHIAFRGDLDTALDDIKREAEAAKLTLNAYSEANPIAASLRSTVSMWNKMSKAVEHGMTASKVDFEKPWADISKLATEIIDSVASGSGKGGGTQQGGPRARKGRQPMGLLDKAKAWGAANLVDETTKAPKANRNLAQVVGVLLQTATVNECNEVLAEVTRIRDLKVKAEDDNRKDRAEESKHAKAQAEAAGVSVTSQGATVKRTPAMPSGKTPEETIAEGNAIIQATPKRRRAKAAA